MKKFALFVLAIPLLAVAAAVAGSFTAAWVPSTTYVDSTPIAASTPLTYNLYTGKSGAETLTNPGLTSLSAAVPASPGQTVCATVTEIANGVESAHSGEVCATQPFLAPNAPTGLKLTLTTQ